MIKSGTNFLRNVFILINLCVVFCYLLVCLLPYINTGKYWYLALTGLLFPLIFFALIFCILVWAFARSKWFWVSFIVLLAGFQQILASFGFNLPKHFEQAKTANTLRILQWNVSSWDQVNKDKKRANYRQEMLDLVKSQDADILCFQEFYEPVIPNLHPFNIPVIAKMGYPYYYFVSSYGRENDFNNGVIIFSKYPMIDSASFNYDMNSSAEHLIYTDIKVNDKIFRIITTHLQSVKFTADDYQSLSEIKHTNKEGLKDSRTIVGKLKRGYTYRYSQAELVHEQIEKSPYPVIVCGDFNDVPNSNTYFKIKDGLRDAFLEKGFFIGRTFRFISPTLRIDYILTDKKFSVAQSQIIHVPYSDHYPVEADLRY
ncbi:MAG: endonuclease/exonuclease/phosphatase family protein [Bacteroidota bacterium]|nr:endonuclease/exonuclease/phosphatase family protein [Bacteroidota bacterium]